MIQFKIGVFLRGSLPAMVGMVTLMRLHQLLLVFLTTAGQRTDEAWVCLPV